MSPSASHLVREIASAIGASLDPEAACRAFADSVAEHLGVEGVAVWTYDTLLGVSTDPSEFYPFWKTGRRDPLSDDDLATASQEPLDIEGGVALPLPRLGVLVLERGGSLSEDEREALTDVASRFAVCLAGALAYHRLQREREDRDRAEAQSRLALERLAALIRTTPAAILVEDADRRVTLANQAFCDLFGIPAPPEAIIGMDCAAAAEQSATLFAEPVAFIEGVDRLLADQVPVISEPLELADGRMLERDYVPVLLDGAYAGHLWTYRDVTDRHRAIREVDGLRQFYEAILEAMPAQLAVFDPDGRYRYVTPSAIRDVERRKQVVGLTDEDYAAMRGLPPDVPRRRMQTILRVAESQDAMQFEESFNTKEGEPRHFVRFITPVVDDAGETTQVLGYGLDITDLKEAERAVRKSEALKRGVFESALDAVITIDEAGDILEFNPAAEQTFGHRAEDVIGTEMGSVIVPERLRGAHDAGMKHYLETGEGPVLGVRIEVPALRANGTEFPCELAITPIRLDDNTEVFTATLRDITERKAAEDALRESEARLRVALDVADLGTWDRTSDDSGDWDARCRAIYGLPASGALSFDDILARIHPEDLDRVQHQLAEAQAPDSDGVYEAEYRVVHEHGEVRWVAARGLYLFEGIGEARHPVRFVGTVQDITEGHLAAEALAASEQRFKQIVEHSQDLIYRADLTGQITFINPVGIHSSGYAEDDLIGMPFWDLVAEDHRGEVVTFYARQVAESIPNTYLELPVVTAAGETVWIGQNVQLIEDEGVPVGVQAVARDITERRLVMEELVVARHAAEQASRAREEFLANMSHEMRTPLNAVLGMGELLRQTALDGEQRHLLSALSFSADQLLALINDLLDVAKIESGQIKFERVPFSLREVVENAAETIRFRAVEKGLDLDVDLAPDLPAYLVGDPVRLSQVLLNLLSNAVKFTQGGRVCLSVETVSEDVLSEHVDGSDAQPDERAVLRFAVEDTGIGIPADKLATIFERFSQARSDTTRRFGGTGLGLAIVKELTERQGGAVHLDSTEGEGSTFTVMLPFTVTEALPDMAPDAADADLSGTRLLLVEDNPLNQFVARRMLEGWGASVDVAEHGAAGVETVESADAEGTPFDLVLMDLQMPEMDGFEATRRIRERYPSHVLPVLALTASAIVEQRDQMDEAGLDGLVLKPFKPAHLRRTIAAHLGRSEPPAPSDSEVAASIDLSAVEESIAGDAEFFAHLVELFQNLVPETEHAMRQALADDDPSALAAAAHRLKSSAGILGARDLHRLLSDLERDAETMGGEELGTLVDEVLTSAAAAANALVRHVQNLN